MNKNHKKIIFSIQLLFSFITLPLFSMNEEEEPSRLLSNIDVGDTIFVEHWKGFRDYVLTIIQQDTDQDGEKEVLIKNNEGKDIGKVDKERKRVITYFDQHPFSLSYQQFMLRLHVENVGKYKPQELQNGLRLGQTVSSDDVIGTYEKLGASVGNKSNRKSENYYDSDGSMILLPRKRNVAVVVFCSR